MQLLARNQKRLNQVRHILRRHLEPKLKLGAVNMPLIADHYVAPDQLLSNLQQFKAFSFVLSTYVRVIFLTACYYVCFRQPRPFIFPLFFSWRIDFVASQQLYRSLLPRIVKKEE